MPEHVSFEPGVGSFCVILAPDEKLTAEWNIPAATVLRHEGHNKFRVVKSLGKVLQLTFVATLKEKTDR